MSYSNVKTILANGKNLTNRKSLYTKSMTKNITPSNLAQFYGSERCYFHPLFRAMNYTEGVKFVSDNGANWLVVAILSHVIPLMKKGEEFIVAKLTKKADGSALLTFDDGNDKILARQEFSQTDFPLPSITFFAEGNMVMLPSER
jgi:hypothetical protein